MPTRFPRWAFRLLVLLCLGWCNLPPVARTAAPETAGATTAPAARLRLVSPTAIACTALREGKTPP